MAKNYVEKAREFLAQEIDVEDDLLDLYLLLAFVKGEGVTNKDVHDAWAIWTNRNKPNHRSLVPYDELSKEVQDLDTPYRVAISNTAKKNQIKRR